MSENPNIFDKLKQTEDEQFDKWMIKQFALACKHERRLKTHLDTSHGYHQYHNARRMKRCVREASAYEEAARTFDAKLDAVKHLLAASMERNEMTPATYQDIIEIVSTLNVRRNNTDECNVDPQHAGS